MAWSLELWCFQLYFSFSKLFWLFWVFCASTEILSLFKLCEKRCWYFDSDCIISLDCFGQYGHFSNICSSNPPGLFEGCAGFQDILLDSLRIVDIVLMLWWWCYFQIPFSSLSLLLQVCTNISDLCIFILYPVSLLNSAFKITTLLFFFFFK